MITPANALKMSIWLAHAHPQAFRTVLQRVRATTPVSTSRVQRLGAFGCGCSPRPLGYTLGYFGQDDSDLPEITVDASAGVDAPADLPAVDLSTLDAPTLSDLSIDPSTINVAGDLAAAGDASTIDTSFFGAPAASSPDTSGGFWSALGSAVSGGLSAVGTGLTTVAKAITSPQAMQAAGTIVGANIAATNAAHTAQLQQAVLQTQLGRVQAGGAPAPIVYAPNAQGQRTPVLYNPSTGQYQPVTASILPSLSGLSSGSVTTVLLIGGAVVLLALLSGPSSAR